MITSPILMWMSILLLEGLREDGVEGEQAVSGVDRPDRVVDVVDQRREALLGDVQFGLEPLALGDVLDHALVVERSCPGHRGRRGRFRRSTWSSRPCGKFRTRSRGRRRAPP